MRTITRREFFDDFQYGVSLDRCVQGEAIENRASARRLLRRLDRNRDGQLRGEELGLTFALIDHFDTDGSPSSFFEEGNARALYRTLFVGRNEGPYFGAAIARAAQRRARLMRADYAIDGAPTSPCRSLSGNRRPNATRLSWLRGLFKCNQFVGDALIEAGVAMPTFKMRDGGHHYAAAETLPRQTGYFDRLHQLIELRPGDVIVVDYPSHGAGTAHAEIVTGIDDAGKKLKVAGAHADGCYEREWSWLFEGAIYNHERRGWESGDNLIYLLRPKRPLQR
jgi:hypothetical protein